MLDVRRLLHFQNVFLILCVYISGLSVSSSTKGILAVKTQSTESITMTLYNYMNNLYTNVFENAVFTNPLAYCIILAFGSIPFECVWEFLPIMMHHYESNFGTSRYTVNITVCITYIFTCIFSSFLVYYFGNRHRPKCVAVGLLFLALATATFAAECELLEYFSRSMNSTFLENDPESENINCPKQTNTSCDGNEIHEREFSFALGIPLFGIGILFNVIGCAFFSSLGFSYIDDNTSKENTLILLGKLLYCI